MVERAFVGAADIHARAPANGFEPLQHLDLRSVVAFGGGVRGVEQIVTHRMAIGGRKGRWQARFWAARTHLAAGSGHRISAGARHLGARRRAGWETVRRSDEHTSELQSLMRNSSAVLWSTKKQ